MTSLPAPRANAYRDTWSGDLRAADAGREVTVAGWVHRRRDHGGLIFIDLRDRTGLLQVVIDPQEAGAEIFAAAERLRSEHVISVRGTVASRGAEHVNPNLPTGEIELRTAALTCSPMLPRRRSPSTRRRPSVRRSGSSTARSICAARACARR